MSNDADWVFVLDQKIRVLSLSEICIATSAERVTEQKAHGRSWIEIEPLPPQSLQIRDQFLGHPIAVPAPSAPPLPAASGAPQSVPKAQLGIHETPALEPCTGFAVALACMRFPAKHSAWLPRDLLATGKFQDTKLQLDRYLETSRQELVLVSKGAQRGEFSYVSSQELSRRRSVSTRRAGGAAGNHASQIKWEWTTQLPQDAQRWIALYRTVNPEFGGAIQPQDWVVTQFKQLSPVQSAFLFCFPGRAWAWFSLANKDEKETSDVLPLREFLSLLSYEQAFLLLCLDDNEDRLLREAIPLPFFSLYNLNGLVCLAHWLDKRRPLSQRLQSGLQWLDPVLEPFRAQTPSQLLSVCKLDFGAASSLPLVWEWMNRRPDFASALGFSDIEQRFWVKQLFLPSQIAHCPESQKSAASLWVSHFICKFWQVYSEHWKQLLNKKDGPGSEFAQRVVAFRMSLLDSLQKWPAISFDRPSDFFEKGTFPLSLYYRLQSHCQATADFLTDSLSPAKESSKEVAEANAADATQRGVPAPCNQTLTYIALAVVFALFLLVIIVLLIYAGFYGHWRRQKAKSLASEVPPLAATVPTSSPPSASPVVVQIEATAEKETAPMKRRKARRKVGVEVSV